MDDGNDNTPMRQDLETSNGCYPPSKLQGAFFGMLIFLHSDCNLYPYKRDNI
jgi:hypothetical protein